MMIGASGKSKSFYKDLVKRLYECKVNSTFIVRKICESSESEESAFIKKTYKNYYFRVLNRVNKWTMSISDTRLNEWFNIYDSLLFGKKEIDYDDNVALKDWRCNLKRFCKRIKESIKSLLVVIYSIIERHLFNPHSVVENYIQIYEKEKYSYHWLYIMSYRQAVFRSLA